MPRWNQPPASAADLAALSAVVNDGTTGLAATKAIADAASAAVATKAPLVHAAQHAVGGADRLTLLALGERFAVTAASTLQTFPRYFCHTAQPLAKDRMGGGRAVAQASGTVSTITLFQSAAGTAPTSLYMCICDVNGVILRVTANLIASMGAALFVTGTLLDPTTLLPSLLAVTDGTSYYLCSGGAYTSGVTVAGVAEPTSLIALAPNVAIMGNLVLPPASPIIDVNTGSKNNIPWLYAA